MKTHFTPAFLKLEKNIECPMLQQCARTWAVAPTVVRVERRADTRARSAELKALVAIVAVLGTVTSRGAERDVPIWHSKYEQGSKHVTGFKARFQHIEVY